MIKINYIKDSENRYHVIFDDYRFNGDFFISKELSNRSKLSPRLRSLYIKISNGFQSDLNLTKKNGLKRFRYVLEQHKPIIPKIYPASC